MLAVSNLTAGYGDTPIVSDVTLELPDGGAVALLGPNGAGKTTLLKAITGLLARAAGTVTLNGDLLPPRRPHRAAASGLCLIPEGRSIFPGLTVRENLTVFDRRGSGLDAATDAFPNLRALLARRAGSLSGGEQQMLAVARAYVQEPSVLLIDEASLGLAPIIVNQLFEHLQHLRERGVGVLVVEQYVPKALAFADHVYVLNRGRVVLDTCTDSVNTSDLAQCYLA